MKRLILCCDGTWNSADQQKDGRLTPTNVVKLAYRLAKRHGDVIQLIFYDQGVGTGNAMDRFLGGAFGEGLVDNIYDAYRFLIANYEVGDELYLFGFSRGAYTARSIGGMIRKCGILDREAVGQYVKAVELYRKDTVHPDDTEAREFRSKYSVVGDQQIPIHFIGVWDTVGALGIPLRGLRWLTRKKHQFHDTELSGSVLHACHALAIDEHRGPFAPTLWCCVPKEGQTVEQVWFCGVHSDVGGGYPEVGASDITLQWMMERARAVGLAFGESLLTAHPLNRDPLKDLHNSKTGLYQLKPGLDRPMGLSAPKDGGQPEVTAPMDATQSIHASVLERWDQEPRYRPKNLRDYFVRTGDARGRQ